MIRQDTNFSLRKYYDIVSHKDHILFLNRYNNTNFNVNLKQIHQQK